MGRSSHLERAPRMAILTVRALIACFIVLANVHALGITTPTSVAEGETITVTVTGSGTLAILINGQQVASGTSSVQHDLVTNTSSAGFYQYDFTSTDPGETNSSRTIEVTDVPLEITVTAPTLDELTTNDVTFALTTSLAPELCFVTIDENSLTLTAQDPTTFSGTFTVDDGVHEITYKCKLNEDVPSVERTLLVDTTPPVVTGSGPSGEPTGPHISLTIDTDEIAQCRYGEQNVKYAELPNGMGDTYALRNTVTLNLQRHGPFTYFVRCRDVHGNAMQVAQVISFVNKVSPIARISIDADEPLPAGTHELTLKTNVELAHAPTLQYELQDSGKVHQVGLTGEHDEWEGFVTIPENTGDTLLRFTFEGKSRQDVFGTTIEKGGVYTIDATPPQVIDAISVHNDSGVIELSWFMKDPEEGTTYNIYRSTKEGVTYADYYVTTRHLTYKDERAEHSRYYYYRVAAVDEAGNIGPLSMEVWGTVIDNKLETPNDPLLTAKIDEKLLDLTVLLAGVNATIDGLAQEFNPSKLRIIESMSLLENAKKARLSIEQEVAALRSLRARELIATEVDAAIARVDQTVDIALEQLIVRIYPESETQVNQQSDLDGLARNLPYVLVDQTAAKEDILDAAVTFQDRLTVAVEARSFSLWNQKNEQRDYTYVKKTMTLEDPQNDVTILEVLSRDASTVTFNEEPGIVDDRVATYTFPVISDVSYSYVIEGIVPMEEVRASRTFAYPNVAVKETNAITGLATKETGMPGFDTILIVIGILIVLGLGAYYVSLSTNSVPFTGLPKEFTAPAPAPPRRVQRTVQKITPPKDMPTTLQEAENAIDEKQYDNALAAYKEVVHAAENDVGLRAQLDQQLLRVYTKLLLFASVDMARVALEQKDSSMAREHLHTAQDLAQRIGDQPTTLINSAKETFTVFVQELNGLEIEHGVEY